jgi:CelD/BcsL family acetyltransferase involved in cellulose biosynthesis
MKGFQNLLSFQSLDRSWIEYVSNLPQVNIFHQPAWSQMLVDCYSYHAFIITLIASNGYIQASLPMMEVNSPFTGRRWISLPFSDHCMPLYNDEAALRQLTEELVLLSKDRNSPPIELRGKYPSHELIHNHADYVLHTLSLESGPEALFDRFHSMHRRNIKKAQKSGMRVKQGTSQEHIDDFYLLHLNNRRRQGIPVQPKRFFNLLRKMILEQGLGFVLCAYLDDECIAAYIFLHWGQTLTYKFGASNPERLDLRPNNLLMWSGIRWGCENGYRTLDMGRSSLSNIGLRKFKSRWGAQESPLIYSTLSAAPLSLTGGKLESFIHTMIRNTPSWVCRATGELLYKHFA